MRSAAQERRAGIIRAKLRGRTGRRFWRSLDELAGTATFRAFLDAEFPALAAAPASIDRRAMLKVMAASLALAGLSGCGEADEEALPYVRQPEFVVPGRPRWYATATTLGGFAQPALGKTDAGRPVKLEGNPDHPATAGATDVFLQASLLGLYDPDRSQSVRRDGQPSTWQAFDAAMGIRARAIDAAQGEGFRLLTGPATSPTLARQIADMGRRWPRARWHVLAPVNEELRLEAARRVFGQPLEQHAMLDQAEVAISLDDDLLGPGPRQAAHAHRWSRRRAAFQEGRGRSRLFVAEPTPSQTGAVAERRLVAPVHRTAWLLHAVARAAGIEEAIAPADLSPAEEAWVRAAAAAIARHPGRALVTIGAAYPPDIQALALLVNARIGALGTVLKLTRPILRAPPDAAQSMERLVEEMEKGEVEALAMVGVNPAYATPADLGFRAALARVPLRIHAGLHHDETARLCDWHLPLAHELESWSDARAVDGTAGIVQPLVRPLYAVRPLHALVDSLAGGRTGDRELVQATWRSAWGDGFADRWRDALVRGFVADSAEPAVAPAIVDRTVTRPMNGDRGGFSVVIRPDPTIWDGSFAGNAWLQETPKPLSKVTWGNVILVGPGLAAQRGIANGDELRLDAGGRIVGPAWIMPGQDDTTVAVTLGYGRSAAGQVAEGLGYDAFAIQRKRRPWHLGGAMLTATGHRRTVATTQLHQAMEGYDFVRTVAADHPAVEGDADAASFYPARQWDSPSWGMSIDLDLCIGCNACVVACVAENNIPMVGPELVAQGREMHWLRVDHYYEGEAAAPRSHFQPVPCMHCEAAPCEMGCPVNAAVHSGDGLNLQVYNRCIGTRTCSSYCPYKVRRFNWYDYAGDDPEQIRAMRNPDVTVRARGVMEKCTYCVQRISQARIQAKVEGRPIGDGEVVTACQQACPTRAIVFGDVTDAGSKVSRRKASPRDYALLEEANTRPRTTYLARIDGGEPEEGSG